MAINKEIKVCIRAGEELPETNGTIQTVFWNQKERKLRSIKAFAACWGGAVLFVPLPILHFICIPALLIAGPVMAVILNAKKSMILGGKGVCPNCKKELPIARAAYKFPFPDLCTNCHTPVDIRVAEDEELTDPE